jgi:hypothetical protein
MAATEEKEPAPDNEHMQECNARPLLRETKSGTPRETARHALKTKHMQKENDQSLRRGGSLEQQKARRGLKEIRLPFYFKKLLS